MVTQEEELLILRQFLRFGETRPIVELMSPRSEPELKKSCRSNVEKSCGVDRGASCLRSEGNLPADHTALRRFKSFAERLSLLFPVSFQGSEPHRLLPPKVKPLTRSPSSMEMGEGVNLPRVSLPGAGSLQTRPLGTEAQWDQSD